MSNAVFHVPHRMGFLSLLALLIIVIFALLLVQLVGAAFRSLGFSPFEVGIILVATLVGSTINIPLWKLRSHQPHPSYDDVSIFGLTFRIPQIHVGTNTTQLAVNLGGALIPTLVSIYLLYTKPTVILPALLGIVIVALLTHQVARIKPGLGIVTPSFVPPLIAALCALLIPSSQPYIVAYTSGTLGTLIGADLSNLQKIPSIGAPVASIGGAGTFDGVFLSGIIAVLLA